MPPNGYRITATVPGFTVGDILNVTRRHRYRDRLELEHIGATPGPATVIVGAVTGFSEADVLDPTARFGDWHSHGRTFDAGEGAAVSTEAGATHLTMATLSTIADPLPA